MNYENLVRDFALRTKRNLEALRALQNSQSQTEVYEVTQLINSLIGLLVFTQQKYVNEIPKLPIDELASQGWPIPKVLGDYPQVENLNQLVRHLRNAIADSNLEIVSDGGGKIRGLRLWNTNSRNHSVTWRADLSVDDIKKITERFIELLLRDTTTGLVVGSNRGMATTSTIEPSENGLRDPAKLEVTDWRTILLRLQADLPIEASPTTPGSNPQEGVNNYAATLSQLIESLLPTLVIASRLEKDTSDDSPFKSTRGGS